MCPWHCPWHFLFFVGLLFLELNCTGSNASSASCSFLRSSSLNANHDSKKDCERTSLAGSIWVDHAVVVESSSVIARAVGRAWIDVDHTGERRSHQAAQAASFPHLWQ